MRISLLLAASLVAAGFSVGNAQTVTVAKTGTPDYATIQAAIDSFDPDPDTGTANVVQITDDAVYSEVITIDVPLTLEGTGANRPILAVQANEAVDTGAGADGLVISVPNTLGNFVDVTLRNLIVIPDNTTPPTDDGIRSNGQNLNLLIEDCLICPNNGSDQPITTDGLSEVSLVGATVFGDDGMFVGPGTAITGDGTEVTIRRTVVSHNNNAAANDGIVCSGSGKSYTIEDGSVFSYNGRLGIQGTLDINIDGSVEPVKVIGNKGFAGIWYAGTPTTERVIDGAWVLNNGTVGSGTGWGIEVQNFGANNVTVSNCIVAGNAEQGILVGTVGTGAVSISDTTVALNGAGPLEIAATAPANVTVIDTILAGDGSANAENAITHGGVGTLTLDYCAVVTSGFFALAPTSIVGTVAQTNIINGAPGFLEIADVSSANFYDVSSATYATAASDGTSPLDGGASYVEETAASDMWNLLQ